MEMQGEVFLFAFLSMYNTPKALGQTAGWKPIVGVSGREGNWFREDSSSFLHEPARWGNGGPTDRGCSFAVRQTGRQGMLYF